MIPQKVNTAYIYYPSLDGLRFWAFLMVFSHNVLKLTNSSSNLILQFIQKNGWIGLDILFIISGFIITRLLLEERKITQNFSIKNFLLRRVLTLWPLYFLALSAGGALAFILLPDHQQLFSQFPFSLTFLGNIPPIHSGYENLKYFDHLWAVSTQMQFYLVWPFLLLWIKNLRRTGLVVGVIILLSIVSRFFLSTSNPGFPGIYTHPIARADTLILGAVLALFSFYIPSGLPKLIKIFASLQVILLMFAFLLLFLLTNFIFTKDLIINGVFGYSVLDLILLYFVFVTLQKNSLLSRFLSFKPFVFLGKISYGLYIWHILAANLILITFSSLQSLIFLVLSLGLTIVITLFFYYIFESKFLNLKKNYTVVKNRTI